MAASDEGIQPIIGVQLGIKRPAAAVPGRPGQRNDPDQLILLAQNEEGYGNLIKLVSQGCLENDAGNTAILPLAALAGSTAGLIALTGGPSGPVGGCSAKASVRPPRSCCSNWSSFSRAASMSRSCGTGWKRSGASSRR